MTAVCREFGISRKTGYKTPRLNSAHARTREAGHSHMCSPRFVGAFANRPGGGVGAPPRSSGKYICWGTEITRGAGTKSLADHGRNSNSEESEA